MAYEGGEAACAMWEEERGEIEMEMGSVALTEGRRPDTADTVEGSV